MNSIVQYLDITPNQEYLVERMKGRFHYAVSVCSYMLVDKMDQRVTNSVPHLYFLMFFFPMLFMFVLLHQSLPTAAAWAPFAGIVAVI